MEEESNPFLNAKKQIVQKMLEDRQSMDQSNNRPSIQNNINTHKRDSSFKSNKEPDKSHRITIDGGIKHEKYDKNYKHTIVHDHLDVLHKKHDKDLHKVHISSNEKISFKDRRSVYTQNQDSDLGEKVYKDKREDNIYKHGDLSCIEKSIVEMNIVSSIMNDNSLYDKFIRCVVLGHVNNSIGLVSIKMKVESFGKVYEHSKIRVDDLVYGIFRSHNRVDNVFNDNKLWRIDVIDPVFYPCEGSQRLYLIIKFYRMFKSII